MVDILLPSILLANTNVIPIAQPYESFVSAILTASIAGAGLIFAVYGIISPLSGRLARERLEKFKLNMSDIEKSLENIKSGSIRSEDFDTTRQKLNEIENIRSLPPYLGGLVIASFLGYIISSLICMWWFLGFELFQYTKDQYLFWIPWTFGISTLIFGYIGFKSIKDIIQVITKEFMIIKDAVEERKKAISPLTEEEVQMLKRFYKKSGISRMLVSLDDISAHKKITKAEEDTVNSLILKGLVNVLYYLAQKEKYSITQYGLSVISVLERSKKP